MEKRKAQSGQVIILMALLSTTLIIFFGLVVNLGHLVQAKKNLQNAVDLAAMVGASYQARYLNAISIMNYRYRQNYKWTLADLYATQSRFNQGLQDELGKDGLIGVGGGELTFGICQQMPGYVPSTPMESGRATPQTNLCQHVRTGGGIPHIQVTPVPVFEPVAVAIYWTNVELAEQFKEQCTEAALQNHGYFRYTMSRLEARNELLTVGMAGILESFNRAFSGGTTLQPGHVADAAIAATFRDNLISANSDVVELQYINPPEARTFQGGDVVTASALRQQILQGATHLGNYFEAMQSSFTVNVVIFANNDDDPALAGCDASVRAQNVEDQCTPIIVQSRYVNANSPTPCDSGAAKRFFLGITRSRDDTGADVGSIGPPKIPFNVVLSARVKPRLLFWPRAFTPTLRAVGAAKPFGSRLGPPIRYSDLELTGNTSRPMGGTNLANMAFFPGDWNTSGQYGMAWSPVITSLIAQTGNLASGANRNRPGPVGLGACDSPNPPFACLALAPTIWESLFWTIFPDPPQTYSRNPAQRHAYPQDVQALAMEGLNPGVYDLVDRGASGPLTAWHQVMTIGERALGNFYASPTMITSAFNPAFDVSSGGDPVRVAHGRSGYQIKLVSIPQICNEMTNLRLSNEMQALCEGDATRVLY